MGSVWQAVASISRPLAMEWTRERFLETTAYTLVFVGAILVLALVVAWVDRWRKRPTEQGTSAGDQLSHFRELHERGEISAEEFARIRGLLADKLRRELKVPTPPAAPETPPEPPPAQAPGAEQ